MIGRARLPLSKRLLLRTLYAQFKAITYVGAANRRYFVECGVEPRKLHFAPHAVDQRHFDANKPEHVVAARDLRLQLGLDAKQRVLLFSGKFIESKQPVQLLNAFLEAEVPNAALVLAGDGPEGAELRRLAGASDRVRFLPFANQSEMPARYLAADVFSLPSRGHYETWGLSVNESMHMGRPCLVSDHVGCHEDLVTHGNTGWVFSWDKAHDLRDKLRQALSVAPELLTKIGDRAKHRVSEYSYANAAHGLIEALKTAHQS